MFSVSDRAIIVPEPKPISKNAKNDSNISILLDFMDSDINQTEV